MPHIKLCKNYRVIVGKYLIQIIIFVVENKKRLG